MSWIMRRWLRSGLGGDHGMISFSCPSYVRKRRVCVLTCGCHMQTILGCTEEVSFRPYGRRITHQKLESINTTVYLVVVACTQRRRPYKINFGALKQRCASHGVRVTRCDPNLAIIRTLRAWGSRFGENQRFTFSGEPSIRPLHPHFLEMGF